MCAALGLGNDTTAPPSRRDRSTPYPEITLHLGSKVWPFSLGEARPGAGHHTADPSLTLPFVLPFHVLPQAPPGPAAGLVGLMKVCQEDKWCLGSRTRHWSTRAFSLGSGLEGREGRPRPEAAGGVGPSSLWPVPSTPLAVLLPYRALPLFWLFGDVFCFQNFFKCCSFAMCLCHLPA